MADEEKRWFEDPTEVLAFARVLADRGTFTETTAESAVTDVLYYFEKPWKWTPEYEEWVNGGRKPVEEGEEDGT